MSAPINEFPIPIAELDAPLSRALHKVVGNSTRAGTKILHQPAYILHSYQHSETSLLLDVFTRHHGRLLVLAKGAKRPYTRWRASIFQTFQTLSLGFSGKGAVRTLIDAEWVGGIVMLQGAALISGYYMNEWLRRALAREDAHARLFDAYQHGLADLGLSAVVEHGAVLRRFELALLRELGFAPTLPDAAQIAPERRYGLVVAEHRWVEAGETVNANADVWLSGQTLLDIYDGRFDAPDTEKEARVWLHALLHHHIADKPLYTRQLLRELQQIQRGEGE